MTYKNNKLGAFIVPTGIGASIGGYAGDASCWAREFSNHMQLIVNPNVVNAGCFSGITPNMLYVEGYTLDSFFKNRINLKESKNNRIGIIYDKAIPQDVLNIHINTQNAVQTIYGINVQNYVITEEEVGVEFFITNEGISVGNIRNISTLDNATSKLLEAGCEAIAVVCLFADPENDNTDYSNGYGVDPVGGVEAIISHYISKKYKVPCAHSPAFIDYSIDSKIVNPKAAAEYITPTFLPCILLGLHQAPKITNKLNSGINISNLDYLIVPHNSLGGIPVLKAIENNIKVFAIKENSTVLEIEKNKLFENEPNIIEMQTYKDCLNKILES